MLNTAMIGVFVWALLLAVPFGWLCRQLFRSMGVATLVLMLAVVVAMWPFGSGPSAAAWAFGVIDLPSLLLIGLLLVRLYRPQDTGLASLWHLGGLMSCALVLSWLLGWTTLFYWGYDPWSLSVAGALFLLMLLQGSLAGALLLMIPMLGLALNVYGTYNSWLYLIGAPFAVLYLFSWPLMLLQWWISRKSTSRALFR